MFAAWMLLVLTGPFWSGHYSHAPPRLVIALGFGLPLVALYILIFGAPGAMKTWGRWAIGAVIFVPGVYGLCYAAVRAFG